MKIAKRTKTILLVVAGLYSLATDAANADQVVKIGVAGPLTGGIAHLGKDIQNGSILAVEEINKRGLVIANQKITLELDTQDDSGDPRQATQVAQKLVDDNVVAVVGHLSSGTSIPASKIYSDAEIVQISPSTTNPRYTLQGFKTTFRVVATDAQQGPALASYAAEKLKLKTVAIVDDATAYGQGLAKEFESKAKSLGMAVVSHDVTNDKAIDFRAILTLVKSRNPQAIMYGGTDSTAGPFIKQAKQLGIRSTVLMGDGACTNQLASLAGDATDRVVCSEAGRSLEKMGKAGQEFSQKYSERFSLPMQNYAPFTYDTVYIIVDAMKRANSVEASKILNEISKTDHNGITGRTTFDSHGDLMHGVISLYDFKNGKKSLLTEVEM